MRKKKKQQATFTDYCALFKKIFGELKRDIFTGDLFVYDTMRRKWIPALGSLALGRMRSHLRDLGESWSVSAAEDHLQALTYETHGEMLVKIPDWDGLERLNTFADAIVCASYSQDQVQDILKHWGANMFRRLYDPTIQNQLLLFLSPQGWGKDTFILSMLRGLEHYLSPFTVAANEADTYAMVCGSLCCHIEEFDRTHRQDPGTIKTIITGESFQFRGAYERKAERRKDRASFIGSCNTSDVLREPGSNRRFIIIDLAEPIRRIYPLGDSRQVLAEWKYLSSQGYEIRPDTLEAIVEVNAVLTPPDIEEEVVAAYLHHIEADTTLYWENKGGELSILSSKLGGIWKELAKETGHTIQTLRSIVKRRGYGKHSREGTRYFKTPREAKVRGQLSSECHTSNTMPSHNGKMIDDPVINLDQDYEDIGL